MPASDEVQLRLEACGVCHTDLHIQSGDEPLGEDDLPLVLGHEGIGRVTAVGRAVEGIDLGDRVAVPWLHDTCLSCRDCTTGHESICADQRAHGMHVNGAFAEYACIKSAFAAHVPASLDAVQAAPLLCAGLTAFGAVRKAALTPGQRCAIFCCGGLGQYGIRLAKLFGAYVIAVDRDPVKLKVAKTLGADEMVLAHKSAGDALREGGGTDACLNFAPTSQVWPAIETSLNPRGRVVSVSMPKDRAALSLTWLTYITPIITGSSVGGRQDLRDILELATQHDLTIPVEAIRLEDVNDALDRLAGKPGTAAVEGRLVIDFARE
ncbi:MAG: alcohol dehydrogenase catalytic domain-containing protein [Pseudomonadota bacterium]